MNPDLKKSLEALVYISASAALAYYMSVKLGVSFWLIVLGIVGVLLIFQLSAWLSRLQGKLRTGLLAVVLLVALGYGLYVWHVHNNDPQVSSLAGTGNLGGQDGPAKRAGFYMPYGVAVVNRVVYVAEYWGQRLRKIDENGDVTTLTLADHVSQTENGPYKVRWQENPGPDDLPPLGFLTAVATGDLGRNLYLADGEYHKIWVVEEHEKGRLQLRRVVGSGIPGPVDASGTTTPLDKVTLDGPEDLVADTATHTLWILEAGNKCIRKVDLQLNRASCYAGANSNCSKKLPLKDPSGLAFYNDTFYISDGGAHQVWVLPLNGQANHIGSGQAGYENGDFYTAKFNYPADVAIDHSSGDVYVSDWGNRCIRRIDQHRLVVDTIAGQPLTPGSRDGPGRFARFQGPCGLAIDGMYLFVTDFEGQNVRRIRLKPRNDDRH